MIFSAEEIAIATGGRLVHEGPNGSVGTDSRRLQPGVWFLALTGDRFDGHDYLPHARAAGCAGAIAQRVPDDWEGGFVEVPDTLRALQDLARFVRAGFHGPVVAITGSAGKTTTRALTSLVLEGLGRIHATAGNLNNHIGLPLSILQAPIDATAWVLELGMNHAGEIDLLQDICQPTIRMITNVGEAHLEGLGSIEGVAQAKGEIFDGARRGDFCCVNMDDPHISALPLPEGVRTVRYGSSQDCDVRLTDAAIDADTLATRFRIETAQGRVLASLQSPGLHLAHNACAAVATGVALRVPMEGIASRLSRYTPVGMRLRIETGPGGIRVINDAYNANPMSMRAALQTLAAIPAASNQRVALLGDMLELGSHEFNAHTEIIALAGSLGIDIIGVAGPRFSRAATSSGILTAPDASALAHAVGPRLHAGDLVLIKGSRSLEMERVLQVLEERTASSAQEAD